MKSILTLSIVLVLCVPEVHAQTDNTAVGNCSEAKAERYLDTGNVRALIFNNGGFFRKAGPGFASGYLVPSADSTNAVHTSTFWVVGKINRRLRAAASRYGPYEFWPGPLDAAGNPPLDCSAYDRLWEIRTEDLQQYIDTGHISDNLSAWPWHLGAPVIDGDGNPNNYNLAGGDIPQLYGDQRIWWVMNDRGNVHAGSRTLPIGLEVHGSAHAFDHPGFPGHSTFYEFVLIYKNDVPFEDAYFTFFMDASLGDIGDEYMGSDSLLHMGYTYNSDNFDKDYGTAPPAFGVTLLETPFAEIDGLDNDRDGDIDEPEGEMIGATSILGGGIEVHEYWDPEVLYNFMQARWQAGEPVYKGLQGYLLRDRWPEGLPRETTRFVFSGDPVTGDFWSELNLDRAGASGPVGERKFITTSGPFSMAPGDTARFRIGIIWARGESNLDSVTKLKQHVRTVHSTTESYYASRPLTPSPLPAEPNHVLGFKQNYPNPFSQTTTLSYSIPRPMQVRLAVYDMLGREVALLVESLQEAGVYTQPFEAGNLPAGVYIAQLKLDHLRFTKRMVIVD